MLKSEFKKSKYAYFLFLIFFYLIIFRSLLENIIPSMSYADEICALLFFPVILIQALKYKIVIRLKPLLLPALIAGFVLFGVLGNIIYNYQSFAGVALPDVFLNLKFWLTIYVAYSAFKNLDLNAYGRRIGNHIKFIVFVFIILILLDNIFNIFKGDIRYGLKSTFLFYGLHSYFAAICGFLIALLTLVRNHVKHAGVYMIVLLLLMTSTLRSKAFGSAILFVLLYWIVYKFKAKIKIWHILLLGAVGVIVGWSQISFYFFSSATSDNARNMLTRMCFEVAKDHFPFGSGFATFASYFSGQVYSPLYVMYGLSGIYGLTRGYPVFVSDTFWPMIIAQNGFFGAAFFIAALVVLFKKIQILSKINKDYYLAALFSLAYLCVSSIAESAFVSPISIPFAIIIGIALKEAKNSDIQKVKETEGK